MTTKAERVEGETVNEVEKISVEEATQIHRDEISQTVAGRIQLAKADCWRSCDKIDRELAEDIERLTRNAEIHKADYRAYRDAKIQAEVGK